MSFCFLPLRHYQKCKEQRTVISDWKVEERRKKNLPSSQSLISDPCIFDCEGTLKVLFPNYLTYKKIILKTTKLKGCSVTTSCVFDVIRVYLSLKVKTFFSKTSFVSSMTPSASKLDTRVWCMTSRNTITLAEADTC